MRPKPRTFIARQALRLAERWTGRTFLPIDYPPREPGPRYGYGHPPHARLAELLGRGEDAYTRNLSMIAGYADDLAAHPGRARSGRPGVEERVAAAHGHGRPVRLPARPGAAAVRGDRVRHVHAAARAGPSRTAGCPHA